MIQAYQKTMMRTEIERLREENAEQRRLLEQARDVLLGRHPFASGKTMECLLEIIEHLKGKA